jgi:thiol:disulfide interchange protein
MLTAILSAFAGGVILNFMPCVFPILSLKVLAVVRHGGAPRQARIEAIAFAGGAIATFTALGAVLAVMRSAGTAVGWGFQLQSPVVTAALSLLMLAAALNLFGVFEVGTSVQGVGQGVANRHDWVGAVFTGVLAVVVASPCVAPFMAGALSYAMVQPPAQSLAVFVALGVGFAAPFLILAFIPGLAAKMPRPGAWMDILRRVFAFPMLGAAAWLAWVSSRQSGDLGLAWLFAAAIFLSFAAWIFGLAQKQQMLGKGHRSLQGLALAAAAAAIAILPMAGQAGPAAPAAAAAVAVASTEPQLWSPERIAALRAQGKPILVNFTASWCVTCQVNDKTALSTPDVKAALLRTGATYLVADSTKFDAKIEDAMAGFGSGGLPLYVVYPAGGGAPTILPQVLTRTLVVQALDKAQKGST